MNPSYYRISLLHYRRGIAVFIFWLTCLWQPCNLTADEIPLEGLINGQAYITKLKSPIDSGRGYRLVYLVKVPLDVYWRFKTDFNNTFLLTNKYIKTHRLISRNGNTIVTENVYTHLPRTRFEWKTIIFPEHHRIEYTLINLKESGQYYHYGHILLKAVGDSTQVTHVSYFDFFGASFWVNFPWSGGMLPFLKYTARWEQETALRLKNTYTSKSSHLKKPVPPDRTPTRVHPPF